MAQKPVIPLVQAVQDLDEAVAHYLSEQAEAAALGFVGALDRGYKHIARYPACGTSRYAHELDLSELRCCSLKRYPYVVFYIERDDHIDVCGMLHGVRDTRHGSLMGLNKSVPLSTHRC